MLERTKVYFKDSSVTFPLLGAVEGDFSPFVLAR